MNIFTLLLFFIGITYGGITTLVGALQLKEKNIDIKACLLMIIGGGFTVTSVIFKSNLVSHTTYLLITGLILIHIAAINNGFKMYGKINFRHHVVRLSISLLLIMLCIITNK